MKRHFSLPHSLVLLFTCSLIFSFSFSHACAKKVKLTIDGKVYSTQTRLYLIINEDIENAQQLPIEDRHFSVTVEVPRDAFVRIHDYKEWPERSAFVLIPDSRHISIDWTDGTIEGSPKSKELQLICRQVAQEGPGNFHVDVFSDDKEAWAEARAQEKIMRDKMQMMQINTIERVIKENNNNNFPAWIVYCYQSLLEGPFRHIIDANKNHKWAKHTIIKKSGVLDKP